MRRCWKCGKLHGRKHSYCAACHAAYMRRTRPKFRELPAPARRKALARSMAKTYLIRGKLTKQPCEVCGSPDVEMHHDDYSKPLAVRWLCRPHHRTVHDAGKVAPRQETGAP